MTAFTYSDRADCIRQIEDRLGDEGTPAIAERMYQEALTAGWAAANDEDVLTFSVTQSGWDHLLEVGTDA